MTGVKNKHIYTYFYRNIPSGHMSKVQEDIICSVVETIAGEDVLPLVEVLKGKKNVSEFIIAEELKEEINTIRNKLYRLYDSNLVEFTRKKDKKKGWYIYYWTFVPTRIPFLLKEMKKKKLEKLLAKLASEEHINFFVCPNECVRQTFDRAMDYEFKCHECGSLMNQEDSTKRIERMKKEIEELKEEINAIPEMIIPQHEHIDLLEEPETEIVEKKIEKKLKNTPVIKNTLKKSAKKTVPKKIIGKKKK